MLRIDSFFLEEYDSRAEEEMKRVIFIWILFLLFMVTQRAWAAEYYVSKSGSDSNPGTEAQPWETIQKAAKTLLAGDTVYIKTGT